jgi:hypothetical protein
MAEEFNSIDNLKAAITKRNGLAKPTQFLIQFSLPAGVAQSTDMQDLSILCQTASLPTRTISTVDYAGTQRHSFKIPSGYSFDNITCTFLVGNDFFPKNLFDNWISQSVDPLSYRVKYLEQYSSTVTIYQLDSQSNPIYGVQLNHAFPTSISNLELDAGSTDQIHKLSVTFSYYDYEIVKNAVSTTIAGSLAANK